MPPAALNPSSLARRGLQVAALNTAIALGLTVAGPEGFATNLLYSQLIGLGIWSAIDLGQALLIPDWQVQWRRIAVLVPLGIVWGFLFGTALADAISGRPPLALMLGAPRRTLGLLVLSMAAAAAATYYFTSREQARQARQREAALRREAMQARLRLLESQLQPHMLFNTLANLRALIAADPPRAQEMLDRLVAYLRSTLSASRAPTQPLADEFARLGDYLALMQIRMGPRLRCALLLPDDLASCAVPTLLLQPLVENSIVHGLESLREGGSIEVSARREHDMLLLEVADSGSGLPPRGERTPAGFGLEQVRERLRTLYGDRADLTLQPRDGGGTHALVRLPASTFQENHACPPP
ncbi:histidine kinase [Ramlibacter sp. AN1015]|uniref:sensor histidine kinase n=1 Tax=Ramlibacter sp. AN1015 TaxID=3133428 RepID=UPI0030BDBD89